MHLCTYVHVCVHMGMGMCMHVYVVDVWSNGHM